MNDIKIILKEFSEKPIAYQPIYSKITGSITAGILLSQLVYWYFAVNENEFYKTDKEFCDELAMGTKELKNAKKKLVELELIKYKRKGVPAKTYYSVNVENIIRSITSYAVSAQLEEPKGTNKKSRKGTTITENTTETTTENIIYTDDDVKLTKLLYEKVKENYPFLIDKKTEKQWDNDYKEMNRLHRIDGWTYRQIEYIIRWSQRDDFWRQNIRSVAKLRKQFENLVVRAKEQNQQKGGVIKT